MVALVYGISAYQRRRGDLPELPVINMFAELSPSEESMTLQSRPGLESTNITAGVGPVTSIFRIDGVLSGQMFEISNGTLFSGGTSLGSLGGSGPSSISGYEDLLFANNGALIYGYDGTSLSPVALPEGALASKIVVGASRLIALSRNTGRFYWSDPLSGAVDDLSFATAENSPDTLLDMLFIGDTLILFGSETVEFWPSSTDPDLPFQPTPGRTYQTGVRNTGSATTFRDTWAWVTNNNQVVMTTPENILSDPGLDVRIQLSPSCRLWSFILDGTEFLVVSLEDETWVYHSAHGTWSEMESYGFTNWLPISYGDGYFGLRNSGTLARWAQGYSDFGGVLERRFRAGFPITGGTMPLSSITIRTNPGQTPFIVGDYTNPTISLRTSKDGGFAWGAWKERGLGVQGSYNIKSTWTSLGFFAYPGGLVEFRVTDPVPFRVSGVSANDPYGGL